MVAQDPQQMAVNGGHSVTQGPQLGIAIPALPPARNIPRPRERRCSSPRTGTFWSDEFWNSNSSLSLLQTRHDSLDLLLAISCLESCKWKYSWSLFSVTPWKPLILPVSPSNWLFWLVYSSADNVLLLVSISHGLSGGIFDFFSWMDEVPSITDLSDHVFGPPKRKIQQCNDHNFSCSGRKV